MKTNWIQVLKNHFTGIKGAGWTDENLKTLDGLIDDILLDTGTTIPGTITTMQGNVTDILADTDELQGEWADGGRLDLLIDAIKAVTDALPDAGALNDLADILLDTGTTIPGTITTMQGNVTDILADTDELQGDWADGGRLDLLIDAIKAVTDALPDAGALSDLATILGLVDSAEAAGPFSYLDAGGEQDVLVDALTTRRRIWLDFSNRNMTETGTFRIYRKVDGTNYDLYAKQPVTVAAGDERAWDAEFTVNQGWKLTYEEDVDEGANRDIPYNVITQVIE